jgi:hypothetical protein
VMVCDPLSQRFGIMVAELFCFLRREIFLLCGVQVLVHLFYDMLSFMEIVNLKVRGGFYHFLCMTALGTEFPFLEMIHVRKGTAGRAPDYEVHGKDVMCAVLIKRYRWIFGWAGGYSF